MQPYASPEHRMAGLAHRELRILPTDSLEVCVGSSSRCVRVCVSGHP